MESLLDPVNKAFAKAIDGLPQPEEMGYVGAREGLEALQKDHVPASDITKETFDVPSGNGTLSVTIFRLKSITQSCRMVYYTHGGGWIMGSPTVYAPLMEDLARQTRAALVFPYYTPAPDKQYPFQYEQVYGGLEHLVKHSEQYNLSADKVVFAGDSVGGHFVIAMMQLALERNLPTKIPQLILFNPVTDTHMKNDSYRRFKYGPFLTDASMNWMIDAFLPNPKDRENALMSPLTFLSDEVLAKFPPTLTVLADVDPLVDEGKAFAHRLQRVGVDAPVFRGAGQLHGYFLLMPLRHSSTARAVVELVAAKISRSLAPAATL